MCGGANPWHYRYSHSAQDQYPNPNHASFFNTDRPYARPTYYLEPVGLLGGGLINQSGYQYAGGTLFLDAVPNQQGFDMWFREGTIVPEPSTFGLLIVTGLALLGWRRCRGSVRQPG